MGRQSLYKKFGPKWLEAFVKKVVALVDDLIDSDQEQVDMIEALEERVAALEGAVPMPKKEKKPKKSKGEFELEIEAEIEQTEDYDWMKDEEEHEED